MPKKIKIPEVKQLIALGKEKGFVTFDEINELLSNEIISFTISFASKPLFDNNFITSSFLDMRNDVLSIG